MANYKFVGDKGILVEFEKKIALEVHEQVRKMDAAVNSFLADKVLETIPSYHSILVFYDPLEIEVNNLLAELKQLEKSCSEMSPENQRHLEIPVLYGDEFGPDLDYVAEYNDLTPEEVIDLHSSQKYRVYMLGFTPGFPYLGGLPERLATPRRKNPTQKVIAGSVGIAGDQTGIYPISSPGGWRIIGNTPLSLFVPEAQDPFLFKPGDIIEFKAIDRNCYQVLSEKTWDEDERKEIEIG